MQKFFQEKNKDTNTLVSKDGKILASTEWNVKQWKELLQELYNGNLSESVLEKEETVEKDDKCQYSL